MYRPLAILTALCCFLVPATTRPPSAWADTVVSDAGVDAGAPGDAPAIVVSDAGVVTPAQGTPAAAIQDDPAGAVSHIVADVKAGNWRLVIASVLGALMVLGIKLRLKVFGTTDRGKAIAVMVLAILGTFSAALATSSPINLSLLGGAVGVAFTAVGGRQWLSRVLWPQDDGKQVATGLQPLLGVKPKG